MKNFSPRFSGSFFTSCFFLLVCSTSLFAVRGGKFPGEILGGETAEKQLLVAQQERERTADRASRFDQGARGTALPNAVETNPTFADENVVKKLLTKPDEEILARLGDSEVRGKFLRHMNRYQAEVAAAVEDPSSRSVQNLSSLLSKVREQMESACLSLNYADFLKQVRFAESLYDFFEREKEFSSTMTTAASSSSSSSSSSAASALMSSMREEDADDATLHHQGTAASIAALSALHQDQSSELNPIREPLTKVYQQRIMLAQLTPKKMDPALPDQDKAVAMRIFKLVDLATQIFHRGENSDAFDSVVAVIKSHRAFLNELKQAPATTPFAVATKNAKRLLLQAEATAVERQVKACSSVKDEAVASLPWNFHCSFEENLTALREGLSRGQTMEQLKNSYLRGIQTKSIGLRLEQQQPSTSRATSQFVPKINPSLVGNQADVLVRLNNGSTRAGFFRQAIENQQNLKNVLLAEMKIKGSPVEDCLHKLMEEQDQKMSVAARKDLDQTEFLKEIKQMEFLYPYVESKVNLLKQLMGMVPTATYLDYFKNISPLWRSMHPKWKQVMDSLDHLAVSRLMFEKVIAERNDLYLTHALDEVRQGQEQEHGWLLLQAQQISPLVSPVNLRAPSFTTTALTPRTTQVSHREMFRDIFAAALCGTVAYLLWPKQWSD